MDLRPRPLRSHQVLSGTVRYCQVPGQDCDSEKVVVKVLSNLGYIAMRKIWLVVCKYIGLTKSCRAGNVCPH
eukprot:s2496_g11.t1